MDSPFKITIGLGAIYLIVRHWEPPSVKNFSEVLELDYIASRPQSVNVTELLHNISSIYESMVHIHGHAKAGLPFLDSQNYLNTLSTYASLSKVNRALIVTGARGSGKSEGILKMIPAWRKVHHIVLDFDFDYIGTVETALAKQISDAFLDVNSTVFECYHASMISECGVHTTLHLKAGASSISIPFKRGDPKWILLLVGAIIITTAPFQSVWLAAVLAIHPILKWIVIGVVVILFFLLVAYFMWSWVWIDALEEFIVEHKLRGLICACSVISKCIPCKQPILIVRHYPTDINSTMALFELLRKGIGLFPIIVEAPDFRWKLTPSVIKSSESFINFHLEHMTFEEGKAQLVDKHSIWTMFEYEKVYDAVGGHMASLRLLFDYHKVLNMTLDKAIARMREDAYNKVVAALREVQDPKTMLHVMYELAAGGFCSFEMIRLGNNETLIGDLETLSDLNIVFIESPGGKVYAQTELMKWGMKEVYVAIESSQKNNS